MTTAIDALPQILGLPSVQVMALVLFVLGVLVGYLLAKSAKYVIALAIVVLIASYFGLISFDVAGLTEIAREVGREVISLLGGLIASSAFIVGAALGLLIGLLK
ncbi:MAG: hypothetical protein OEY99_06990 [Aigarchaeota archaeon]|nr:hypothetical protein [Aigarchaeota archaeon]